MKKVPFDKLAYGGRFRYIQNPDNPTMSAACQRLWVKIGPNEIAEWDDENACTGWIGQSICCFSESHEGLKEEVEFVT